MKRLLLLSALLLTACTSTPQAASSASDLSSSSPSSVASSSSSSSVEQTTFSDITSSGASSEERILDSSESETQSELVQWEDAELVEAMETYLHHVLPYIGLSGLDWFYNDYNGELDIYGTTNLATLDDYSVLYRNADYGVQVLSSDHFKAYLHDEDWSYVFVECSLDSGDFYLHAMYIQAEGEWPESTIYSIFSETGVYSVTPFEAEAYVCYAVPKDDGYWSTLVIECFGEDLSEASCQAYVQALLASEDAYYPLTSKDNVHTYICYDTITKVSFYFDDTLNGFVIEAESFSEHEMCEPKEGFPNHEISAFLNQYGVTDVEIPAFDASSYLGAPFHITDSPNYVVLTYVSSENLGLKMEDDYEGKLSGLGYNVDRSNYDSAGIIATKAGQDVTLIFFTYDDDDGLGQYFELDIYPTLSE